MMQYNITIKMFQFNGVNKSSNSIRANWTSLSSFNLNPTKTIGRSRDGRVRIKGFCIVLVNII